MPRLVLLGTLRTFLLLVLVQAGVRASAADPDLQDLFAARPHATTDSGSARANTSTATLESGEPRHGGKAGGHSVWLSWTAPSRGIATFATEGSSFDTLLAVYRLDTRDPDKPAMDRLQQVISFDDNEGSPYALVQFGVEAGATYEIALDGYQGASGAARLRWDLVTTDDPPPVFLQVPPDRALRLGDAVTLTVGFQAGPDVRLAWLFNGDDQLLGTESDTLTIPNFQANNVGRYQLRITAGRVRMTSAPIELQVNSEGEITTLARDKLLDAVLSGLIGSGAAPDLASTPEIRVPRTRRLAGPGVTRGYQGTQIFNTLYAAREPGEPAHCGQSGGASYWFAYQAPSDGTLTLDTDGSSFDTVLAVYTDNGALQGFGSLISLACDDNSGANGLTSRLTVNTTRGAAYFIVVDGVQGARGTAHLRYQLQARVPTAPPSILESPVSQTCLQGQSLTLAVAATGSAPLTYQWFKDGAALPNATSASWSIPAVQTADAGSYTVRIENAAGSITSAPATITVLVPPRIVVAPVSTNVVEGQALALSVDASGSAPLAYQWYRDGSPVAGAVHPSFQISAVDATSAGSYAVRIENSAGAIISAPVVVAVGVRIQLARSAIPGELVLSYRARAGLQYRLEAASTPDAGSWVLVDEGVNATEAGVLRLVVEAVPSRFFRLIVRSPATASAVATGNHDNEIGLPSLEAAP